MTKIEMQELLDPQLEWLMNHLDNNQGLGQATITDLAIYLSEQSDAASYVAGMCMNDDFGFDHED